MREILEDGSQRSSQIENTMLYHGVIANAILRTLSEYELATKSIYLLALE